MYEINCYDSYGNSINYLTQWDYNRKLIMYIDNYDLSIAPEVHFSNNKSEEALVVQSVVDGDKITVDIPNILLQQSYPLLVHVYLTDINDVSSQKTIAYAEILIKKKAKPSDYTYIENIDHVTSEQIKQDIYNDILANGIIINSSTEGSTKKFKITVDDSGTISATEVI